MLLVNIKKKSPKALTLELLQFEIGQMLGYPAMLFQLIDISINPCGRVRHIWRCTFPSREHIRNCTCHRSCSTFQNLL